MMTRSISKRVLAFLLTLAMMLGTMGMGVFAAEIEIHTASNLNDLFTSGGEGRLEKSFDIDIEALDKTVVLDLNGQTLTLNNTLSGSGTLTVKDGSAMGNGKITGSLVDVPLIQCNTLNMQYGTIDSTNTTAVSTTTFNMSGGTVKGGTYGVNVHRGTFTFSNGTIEGTDSAVRVGIDSTFTMTGGTLNSGKVAAVDVSANATSMTVGGSATITGNTTNVKLAAGKTITVQEGFTGTIGVTTVDKPTTGVPVPVTGTNSSNITGKFTSDDSAYEITNGTNNVVQLGLSTKPTAKISNVTITGTKGTALTEQTATITVSNLPSGTRINGTDATAWVTNKPEGVVVGVSETDFSNEFLLTFSGTPSAVAEGALAITIPKGVFGTDVKEAITVAANANAKWKIVAATPVTATVADRTITGTVGTALTGPDGGQKATITVNGLPAGTKVKPYTLALATGWTINTPAGVIAAVSTSATTAPNEFKLAFSGTPTEASTAPLSIIIPKGAFDPALTADITVTANANAKWNITGASTGTPTVTFAPDKKVKELTAGYEAFSETMTITYQDMKADTGYSLHMSGGTNQAVQDYFEVSYNGNPLTIPNDANKTLVVENIIPATGDRSGTITLQIKVKAGAPAGTTATLGQQIMTTVTPSTVKFSSYGIKVTDGTTPPTPPAPPAPPAPVVVPAPIPVPEPTKEEPDFTPPPFVEPTGTSNLGNAKSSVPGDTDGDGLGAAPTTDGDLYLGVNANDYSGKSGLKYQWLMTTAGTTQKWSSVDKGNSPKMLLPQEKLEPNKIYVFRVRITNSSGKTTFSKNIRVQVLEDGSYIIDGKKVAAVTPRVNGLGSKNWRTKV